MLEPEVKRGRVGKPKVKTGCWTCKKRKVKCDERKPGCARCHKFGVECDGYISKKDEAERTPRKVVPTKVERVLLPKDCDLRPQFAPSSSRSPQPSSSPSIVQERSVYSRPVQYNSYPFTSTIDDHLMNTIMYQDCNNHPAIQGLMSSISALHKAKSGGNGGESAIRLQDAFQQYGEAIQVIREVASSTTAESARILSAASQLIYVFESMQTTTKTPEPYLGGNMSPTIYTSRHSWDNIVSEGSDRRYSTSSGDSRGFEDSINCCRTGDVSGFPSPMIGTTFSNVLHDDFELAMNQSFQDGPNGALDPYLDFR